MKKPKLDPLTRLQLEAIREQIDVLLDAGKAEVSTKPPKRGKAGAKARTTRGGGSGPTPAPAAGLNIQVLPRPLSTRARAAAPTLVVLHATAGASAQSSIDHLRSVSLSYHFIITRDGRDTARTRNADGSPPIIFQCTHPAHRAAHVGSTIPAPSGVRINEASIGISLANMQDGEAYTPGQIAALDQLVAHLKRAHPSLRHLTNHALVQPWNRADPVRIDASALAARHGYTLFRPTAQQIRDHRP